MDFFCLLLPKKKPNQTNQNKQKKTTTNNKVFCERQIKNEILLKFQSRIQGRERYFFHDLVGLINEHNCPFWHHTFNNSYFEVVQPKIFSLFIFMCLCKKELDSDPLLLYSTLLFSSLAFHQPYIYQFLPYSEENFDMKLAHFS